MTIKNEYMSLRGLQSNQGYQILQALWMQQISKIEESRDKAAQRGNDTAWRYWAGQEKGFKLAVTALERALVQMQREEEELKENPEAEKILEELRLKRENQ